MKNGFFAITLTDLRKYVFEYCKKTPFNILTAKNLARIWKILAVAFFSPTH